MTPPGGTVRAPPQLKCRACGHGWRARDYLDRCPGCGSHKIIRVLDVAHRPRGTGRNGGSRFDRRRARQTRLLRQGRVNRARDEMDE